MDFQEPNILFLKSITINDIYNIEDIYQQEILNNIKDVNKNEIDIIYDKIPKTFTTLQKWKRSTNIKCWFCSLKFKNSPWFIIENTINNSEGDIYEIKGNFCSVGCLQGYANIYYHSTKDFDIFQHIKKLYKIFYNKNIREIEPSPDKYYLKIYGGNLDISEYQKKILEVNIININNGY